MGRLEEMNDYNEQALVSDRENPESLNLRASYLQLKGQPGEALGFAERAVAIAPNNVSALSLLARLESELGLKERGDGDVEPAPPGHRSIRADQHAPERDPSAARGPRASMAVGPDRR